MNIKNFIQKVGSIFFPNMSKGPESILAKKGNQIHVFLIYLAGAYMFTFGIINYFIDDKTGAAIVNFSSIPLIAIVFIFYRIGWTLISKLLNLTLILTVIILIFLLTRSKEGLYNGDSILAFFIPVFIGALIIFQGKERKVGVIFAFFVLILMTILISSDFHLGDAPAYSREQVRRELALNIIGAAVATMLEVVFIMMVNNRTVTPTHAHGTSHLSFVYYMNMPKEADAIAFQIQASPNEPYYGAFSEGTNRQRSMILERNALNANQSIMLVEEAQLLVFPSHLHHGTVKMGDMGNGQRVALAGDVILVFNELSPNYATGVFDPSTWRSFGNL